MQKRTEPFIMRFTSQEKMALENQSWLKHMSMAEYIRWLIAKDTKKGTFAPREEER